jgi:hypothetical protein
MSSKGNIWEQSALYLDVYLQLLNEAELARPGPTHRRWPEPALFDCRNLEDDRKFENLYLQISWKLPGIHRFTDTSADGASSGRGCLTRDPCWR